MRRPAGGMIRPYLRELMGVARVVDLALIAAALWLANALYGRPWSDAYTVAAAGVVLLYYLAAELLGLYRSWRSEPFRQEVAALAKVWFAVGVGVLFLGYATKTTQQYSRLTFGTWFWLAPALLLGWRAALRGVLRRARRLGRNTRRAAIAGASEAGAEIARTIERSPWMGIELLGWYDDRAAAREPLDLPGPRRGDLAALVEDARAGVLDVVYIALPIQASERVAGLVEGLADSTASVYVVPDFFVFRLAHGRWVQVGEVPAVSVYETPFYGLDGWVKRAEDVILGSLCLALAALPMAIIAIGVKLSSPGPVLFRQRRWGLDGREFRMWKFRTMRVLEDGAEVSQARRGDPRVTPFGAFLRRTSLDELPQLFNVLGGSMSLVGPRPHASAHNEAYRRLVSGYMLRHKVKPGITGWAQANGWRGETETHEKMARRVEHDLWYIRNWSVMLDLKILLVTAVRLLRDEAAY